MNYNFESNSNNSKKNDADNKERLSPVIEEDGASIKKKSFVQKMLSFFMDEDIENVGEYLKKEVIKPQVKRFLYDFITGSASTLIYHNNRPSGIGGYDSSIMSYNDYTRAYGSTSNQYRNDISDDRSYDHSTDINFHQNQDKAFKALRELEGRLAHYHVVSVLDLYDVSNLGKYTIPSDDRYGWKDLRNARVSNIRGEWILKMPPAFPLD